MCVYKIICDNLGPCDVDYVVAENIITAIKMLIKKYEGRVEEKNILTIEKITDKALI